MTIRVRKANTYQTALGWIKANVQNALKLLYSLYILETFPAILIWSQLKSMLSSKWEVSASYWI